MCHILSLASPRPLSMVISDPTSPPTFSVQPATGLRPACFPPGWHVYDLGSITGCACGFHDDDPTAGRAALHHYLHHLGDCTGLQLYDCWEGEVLQPALEQHTIELDDLVARAHPLQERRHLIIR